MKRKLCNWHAWPVGYYGRNAGGAGDAALQSYPAAGAASAGPNKFAHRNGGTTAEPSVRLLAGPVPAPYGYAALPWQARDAVSPFHGNQYQSRLDSVSDGCLDGTPSWRRRRRPAVRSTGHRCLFRGDLRHLLGRQLFHYLPELRPYVLLQLVFRVATAVPHVPPPHFPKI